MKSAIKATICFMTGRADPHLDWILDSLATYIRTDDEIELIVVDGFPGGSRMLAADEPTIQGANLWATAFGGVTQTRESLWGEREHAIYNRIPRGVKGSALAIQIVPPKPCIWQGSHRVTAHDWWATANARNTAIAMASHPWIVFIDDRSRLGPHWLDAMRFYANREMHEQSVVAGTYDKIETAAPGTYTEDGKHAVFMKRTTDHRRALKPDGLINCGGGWLYGCTMGMPLEWALGVNGLEEGCDSLTGEDYIFGLMLGNAGRRIDFCTQLYVEQDRTEGTEHPFRSTDKGISPDDKSHAALNWFGKARRTVFTPDLQAIRATLRQGGEFPVPDPSADYRDWFDGQLIREMRIP